MEQLLVSYAEPLKEFAGPKRSLKDGADWLHSLAARILPNGPKPRDSAPWLTIFLVAVVVPRLRWEILHNRIDRQGSEEELGTDPL